MISFIKGKIEITGKDYVVIENNGIGYNIKTSLATIGRLPRDKEVKVYTHMQVREDDISLYGFAYLEEISIFTMLTSVSGIGPKAALAILDMFTPQDVMLFIMSDDSKSLSKAKGVGPKTAQRIILELKDKMKSNSIGNTDNSMEMASTVGNIGSGDVIDAIDALIALGYEKSDAVKAVNSIYTEELTIQDIIKKALKALSL